MKEYKVLKVKQSKELEGLMNKMAQDNWEVKTVMERTSTLDIHVAFERNIA